VIFVDSNIPMYLIGAEHPFKADARRAIEDAIAAGDVLCTDAEVFQEMLHRYRAIDRADAIDAGFAALLGIVDVTYSIELSDVERARRLLRTTPTLSARDAIHVAVMQAHDVSRMMSFDRGFDGLPGIVRIA
jgi:hypothetical protein